MIKRIMLAGLIAVAGVGFVVLQANAQVYPAAQCGTTAPSTCAVGYAEPATVSGNTTTWTCIASVGTVTTASCSYTASQTQTSPNACSQTTAYQCSAGYMPAFTGYQPGDPGSGSGYIYWGCQVSGGPITNCALPVGSGGSSSGSSGSSQSVACYASYNCSLGQTCFNAGLNSSYCGLPGNSGNGNTQTVAQALSSAGLQGAACTGNFTTDPTAVAACDNLFKKEAAALGYSSICTDTLVNSGVAAQNPFYNSSCTLSGNGLLGQMNGSIGWVPYDVIGYSSPGSLSPTGSQNWYTVENGYGGSTVVTQGSSGSSSSGSGVSGTGSGTSSSGLSSGSGTSASQTTPPPTSVSTLNSTLSGSFNGFSSVLSSINAAANVAGSGASVSGSAGASTSGSTGTTSNGSGGGTCASAAATTISSSLQTLQGLAGILSAGNVPTTVLTSVQNLINSVAQVLSALGNCIISQSGTSMSHSGTGSNPTTGSNGNSGSNSGVSLRSLSPSSGSVGTPVLITGTGFDATNTILINGLSSANLKNLAPTTLEGVGLMFQIPATISVVCPSNAPLCPGAILLVSPGTYNVTVTNANGVSNPLIFTVTSSTLACPPNAECATPFNAGSAN